MQTTFQKHFALIAYLVKNPPAMQETLIRFLGLEDPLENPFQDSWAPLVAQLERIGLQCRRLGSILGWENPLEKGKATPSSILT